MTLTHTLKSLKSQCDTSQSVLKVFFFFFGACFFMALVFSERSCYINQVVRNWWQRIPAPLPWPAVGSGVLGAQAWALAMLLFSYLLTSILSCRGCTRKEIVSLDNVSHSSYQGGPELNLLGSPSWPYIPAFISQGHWNCRNLPLCHAEWEVWGRTYMCLRFSRWLKPKFAPRNSDFSVHSSSVSITMPSAGRKNKGWYSPLVSKSKEMSWEQLLMSKTKVYNVAEEDKYIPCCVRACSRGDTTLEGGFSRITLLVTENASFTVLISSWPWPWPSGPSLGCKWKSQITETWFHSQHVYFNESDRTSASRGPSPE